MRFIVKSVISDLDRFRDVSKAFMEPKTAICEPRLHLDLPRVVLSLKFQNSSKNHLVCHWSPETYTFHLFTILNPVTMVWNNNKIKTWPTKPDLKQNENRLLILLFPCLSMILIITGYQVTLTSNGYKIGTTPQHYYQFLYNNF